MTPIIRSFLTTAAASALGLFVSLPATAAVCSNTVQADVVAIDQQIMFNRLGAVNPIGQMFALRIDVVDSASGLPECSVLAPTAQEPGVTCVTALQAGQAKLRDDKRPRPLALRVNEGDCLQVHFQNLLAPAPLVVDGFNQQPATRSVGVTFKGVSLVNSITDQGVNVGISPSGLVGPSGSMTYTVRGEHEGTYHITSQSDTVSGEGVQGQGSFGLFGALNVQKSGAEWYRSTVTNAELLLATTGTATDGKHPIIDYGAVYPPGHRFAGQPILKITNSDNRIVHNELNAVITGPGHGDFPAGTYQRNPSYPNRDKAFREFTVIFHDEVEAVQPFPIFIDPAFKFTLAGVKDAFMINYGSNAVGTEVVANRLGVGPTWDCPECKFEEFFLTSWAVSDPGLLVDIPANAKDLQGNLITGPKATKALYPADPSNVFHTYIGDRAKIRNLHVGKEFHVFHLHAQQWLFSPDDDGSTYLDAQGIGPGSAYTYEMVYGSGNRNMQQGDAIFHCHFYPHFAQGMWALYRNHDVFEAGTELIPDPADPLCLPPNDPNGPQCHQIPKPGSRALPDGEISAGTFIPAVIPIPTLPMAPMPGKVHIATDSASGYRGGQIVYDEPDKNAGYPFNLGMKAGHRPATPPLDIIEDGGLPRHIVRGSSSGIPADPGASHSTVTPLDFNKELLAVRSDQLPETGTRPERAGMNFHARRSHATFLPNGSPGSFLTNGMPPAPGAPFADPCRSDSSGPAGVNRTYKAAVIQFDLKHNKLGQHFPQSRILSLWGDAQATVDGSRPPEPFFMRANSNECVNFYHTNLAPSIYEQDDFQVKTPTDIIGQHIHLVKFDVTSSDGSANGYNYEDGTMSPDEVRERIHAINATGGLRAPDSDGMPTDTASGTAILSPKAHSYFGSSFNGRDISGARTTIQRWYVDNLLNNKGEDRTLGNVFTHDHFGPSTHQQAGLYATLITEPQGSRWRNPETGQFYGGRFDGGPTSWRADIITANPADSFREFMFQAADFAIAYENGACHTVPCTNPAKAINPPGRVEVGLPFIFRKPQICPNGTAPPCPTAISVNDDGTFLVNYRNEPVGERVRNPQTNTQSAGAAGDMAYAYASNITRSNPLLNVQPGFYPPLTANVGPSDPFTPLLQAYNRDKVRVRFQVGATEESHNATIHGLKWLQEFGAPNSGYRNSQHAGISEQFIFDTRIIADKGQVGGVADYLYSLNSSADGLWAGAWGLLRSYNTRQNNLLPLPNNPVGSVAATVSNDADFNGVCPKSATVRSYDVSAISAQDSLPGGTLTYNARSGALGTGPLNDSSAIIYVQSADLDGQVPPKLKANVPIEPLVLRAAAGDCIEVTLRNRISSVINEQPGFNAVVNVIDNFNYNQVKTSTVVGLHPQLVEFDITRGDGSRVGINPDQTVAPGNSTFYRWYAGDVKIVNNQRVATPVEFGVAGLMPPDGIKQPSKGVVGALVIEPRGSSWVEDYPTPHPRVPLGQRPSRTSAVVIKPDNSTFREQVLVIQNNIAMQFGNGTPVPATIAMEDALDMGIKSYNYRSEPLWFRMGINPLALPNQIAQRDFSDALSNSLTGLGADPTNPASPFDPVTPIATVKKGDEIRLRIVNPGGNNRNHVFALNGHVWQREPYGNASTVITRNPKSFWTGTQDQLGPSEHFDIIPDFGAGGAFGITGDYLYRDMLPVHFLNGHWGIMRVEP